MSTEVERLRKRLSRLEDEIDEERDPEERRILRRQARKLEDRIDEAESAPASSGPAPGMRRVHYEDLTDEEYKARFGGDDDAEGEGEEGEGAEGELRPKARKPRAVDGDKTPPEGHGLFQKVGSKAS